MTPEEKLLHLIRRSDKKVPKIKQADQAVPVKDKEPVKPLPPPHFNVPEFKQGKNILSGISPGIFTFINRLILFMVLAAFLLFLFDLYSSPKDISKSSFPLRPQPEKISLKEKEIKPYSYYQQEVSKRNIFGGGSSESKVSRAIPTGITFKELVKDLRILGIVSGDKPQVIIEDTKLTKTYFLYTGDYLGDIKIEAINPDSVELEFKGEKINLFL